MLKEKRLGFAVLTATSLALATAPAFAAEETLNAFSVWIADGRLVTTAPNQATFVGALEGIVYINTEEGPVEAGQMLCPAVVRIDTKSGAQSATGNCTFTAPDGAQLFAELSCTGVHLIGCSGEMKLTGGTGRLDKVTGGGAFTIRSGLQTVALPASNDARPSVHGIIFWPQLKYVLP